MCADLNMPNPMVQHTFQENLASIKSAAKVAAKQNMDIATMELQNAMDVHGDELTEGTQWKEPARGGPCYELMSSTNAFQPFPPSGDSTPEVERCP